MSFPTFLTLILFGVSMVRESESAPMNTFLNPSGSEVDDKSIKQAEVRLKGETKNLETPKQASEVGDGVQTKDSETPLQAGVGNDFEREEWITPELEPFGGKFLACCWAKSCKIHQCL